MSKILLHFLAFTVLLGVGCTMPANDLEDDDAGERARVADFTIALYQGEAALGSGEFALSDLEGTPVVLNYWAGLCPPCRAEMPEFQEFGDDYEGRVILLGVDLGKFLGLGTQEDARNLLAELGVTYPAGYTEDGSVVEAHRVLGLPTTIFVNSDGILHRKWDGILNKEKLSEIAEEMLKESGE